MLKSAVILTCAVACALFTGHTVMALDDTLSAQTVKSEAQSLTTVAMTIPVLPANAGSVTSIPKSQDGHYWAEARVNDASVKFLIDTGATIVALTPSDALRLGVDADELKYDRLVTTAMGKTEAAVVKLRSVHIGQTEVRDVEAIVIREGLSTSLLGMSYLGRLSGFEATRTALILKP
ncbi:TIGR02281 family clan AA aspartic protease [Asticcacaulis sp. ZE23SCel15]|uniref:TIGR02281 family clan AA aspartic protease n=1 Tax=Asticcacaulis sp. ZE23SCel15 TaxID=3059027 RepID=UPI00265F1443|nr:TIGR02281 family clan AA aspartic protease [Asticcacaulis sp. ZE23SCel15]WKL55785.1 TIGR02281 family clan AA aspartic protease [Asticcacaulis sp. ZE23SCel15]